MTGNLDYDAMLKHYLDAVVENNLPIVKEALQHIDVMACNQDLDNALILASLNGHYEMIGFVKFLVEQIPKEERKYYIKKEGNQLGITPIIAACASGNVKILKFLLSIFADEKDISLPHTDLYNTCMGIACANGHLDIVKFLIAKGDDFLIKGFLCPHPLMLAMINGHKDILIYFYLPSLARSPKLQSYPPEVQQDILTKTANTEMIPEVDIDECCPEFHNLNILTLAVVLKKTEMFELLCELGADFDFQLPDTGNTVRQVAENYDFQIPSTSPFDVSVQTENSESTAADESFGSNVEKKNASKKHRSLIKKFGRLLLRNH